MKKNIIAINNILTRFSLIILLLNIGVFSVYAQKIPDKPSPARLVNDFAGVMSQSQKAKLENYLEDFARKTSTQIVVVTVNSTEGTDVADFTFKLGNKWGVGQKGKNNGAVMLIKPKTATSRGHAFIATGYGLEGAIPDAIARQIVDNEMIPQFKQNNYFAGIAKGVKVITDITRGEYSADEYHAKHSGNPFAGIIGIIVIFIIVTFLRTSSKHGRNNMGGSNLPFWLLLGMMGGSSRDSGGGFGNFSSGSGGFGGFGGGGFGGGGAGGSW